MKRVGIFLNNTDDNVFAYRAAHLVQSIYPEATFDLIVLEEKLPEYSRFPSAERKERLEELLSKVSAVALADAERELEGVKINKVETLQGSFPKVLIDHCENQSFDLVIKQPLLEPEDHNTVSKGDIKLLREIKNDILMARSSMLKFDGVLTGIATFEEESRPDPLVSAIATLSQDFAKKLGGVLHVAHAWRMVGQEILKGRVPEEEYRQSMADYRELESKSFNMVFDQMSRSDSKLEFQKHIHNGDPTRVIAGLAKALTPSLIVMGAVSRSMIQDYLLGSTAESIAKTQPFSILIAKV